MSPPVVLITGCSSGIGKGLALEFKRRQCRVFASARSVSKLKDLEQAGIDVVQLDVASAESVQAAVEEVISRAGRIDILVNNAGLSSYAPAIEIPQHELRQLMETNFFGLINLTQTVVHKSMLPARSGTVVMISSMMGEIVTPFNSAYAATKAAVTRYSDALRIELAPFGVHVVTVKPGGVQSDIANNAREKTDAMLSAQSEYLPIAKYIKARSEASQHHPMLTHDFAAQVVAKILAPNIPATITLGKNSWLLWLAAKFIPLWVSDLYFSRKFGLSELRTLLQREGTKKLQ